MTANAGKKMTKNGYYQKIWWLLTRCKLDVFFFTDHLKVNKCSERISAREHILRRCRFVAINKIKAKSYFQKIR